MRCSVCRKNETKMTCRDSNGHLFNCCQNCYDEKNGVVTEQISANQTVRKMTKEPKWLASTITKQREVINNV